MQLYGDEKYFSRCEMESERKGIQKCSKPNLQRTKFGGAGGGGGV